MLYFLTSLAECSAAMSILALFYIAITPLLKKRYTAIIRYYTWLVIVIGFIIPFRPKVNIARVEVNIFSYVPSVQQNISDNAKAIGNIANSLTISRQTFTEIPWYYFVGILWLVGAVSLIVCQGLKHGRFMKMIRHWSEECADQQTLDVLLKLRNSMGIFKQVKILVCPCVSSPMMVGFICPTIILPAADFSENEIFLVLKHELIHFKRKDLWFKVLILTATAIHWFNPVVYIMAKAIATQCEIACDEEVVRDAGLDSRQQYSETIIGIIKNQSRIQTALSTNFYGGKKEMKNRIFSIMDATKKKAGAFIICFAILGTVGTGTFAVSNQAATINKSVKFIQNSYEQFSSVGSVTNDFSAIKPSNKEAVKKYSIYAKYGLIYDLGKDSFYYNGKLVRLFFDEVDGNGTYTFSTRPDGEVDLKAVRNEKYELTGIVPVSQEEYNQMVNGTEGTEILTDDSEETNDESTEGSLTAYLNYGVSYNKTNDQWIFNNKPVHFLSDGDYKTFFDNSDSAVKYGAFIKVIRKNRQIDKLVEITQEEAKALPNYKFVKNMINNNG